MKRLSNKEGFTLIEIITVVVVLGILSVFTFSFINNAITTYMIGKKQRMIYQDASYSMERITREIRDAGDIYIMNAGTANSILYIWPKKHPTGMDSNLNVWFARSGNNLVRSSMSSQVLGSNITQFRIDQENCSWLFLWYYCSGTDPKGTLTITLSVTDLDIPISDVSSKTVTISTKVSPKNYTPIVSQYTGRSYNGDYEDVIQ